MRHQINDQTNQYESILEAYKKGELWSQGACLTTACSSEGPITIEWFKRNKEDSASLSQ